MVHGVSASRTQLPTRLRSRHPRTGILGMRARIAESVFTLKTVEARTCLPFLWLFDLMTFEDPWHSSKLDLSTRS